MGNPPKSSEDAWDSDGYTLGKKGSFARTVGFGNMKKRYKQREG